MSQVIEVRDNGRKRVRTVNTMESKTVQSDVNRSDIKFVLQKYEQTGVMFGLGEVDLTYRDVGEFEDFADLMLQSKNAEGAFMRLPSKVREAFDHDVAKWLDAAHDGLDPEQRTRLEKLGVLEAVQDAAPNPVPEPSPGPPAESD